MGRFGYINTVDLVGVGATNNPGYSNAFFSDDVIVSPASIGGLQQVEFVVDTDGLLQPQGGVASKSVNGGG
jgi:hypothetical protein